MFSRKKQPAPNDPYKNGFVWQKELPLTKLTCAHFVRVFPCTDMGRYLANDRYHEAVLNESLDQSLATTKALFGLPLEQIGGTLNLIWGELLNSPPTHQIVIGYIIHTGKKERRIIDVKVSLSQLNRDDKDLSLVFGAYFVGQLQRAESRWALFQSGENTKWYLTCLQNKYKSLRGVLK